MQRELYKIDSLTLHVLQRVASYFSDHHTRAYLVGGALRNLLLGESFTDWDIAVHGDAPRLARRLADKLHGYYAYMNEKASRVVVKEDAHGLSLDISPMLGDVIEEDLRQRDFTVNAMAVPLDNLIQHFTTAAPLTLIDPLQGLDDLDARILRACNEGIFRHDPLRMLRAVRFMARYRLTIESHTQKFISRDSSLLPRAASERIHEELYTILRLPGATERLRFLDQHGLFTALFPEFIAARGMPQPALHYWDVLEHSLESVAALEHLASLWQQSPQEIACSPLENSEQHDLQEVRTLLEQAEQEGIFQFTQLTAPPMKLAALLHDIGKPVTYAVDDEGNIHFYGHPQAGVPLAQQIMQRLSASTHDRRLVQQVVAHHMRPGQLSQTTITERAIRRYFVELGPAGIIVALVSLADHLAMRGPEPLARTWYNHLATVRLLLTRYIRERERILPPRIIQAEELMRRLKIAPGPLVGQLLDYIAEAQAEGLIHSKDDALWLAEEKLQQSQAES
ncbi:HD domain-containing protein [Ktedonosporobacter rubrisoli]|uniref:HD domain-containing protein n=1 Tax=Ktedonosporobacter rubrisoli TaxID=2509675 RepID=A0A4P6K2D8_KTERU|nr:HD domain-containing protein [Ktedonosporobacter rubrisoli]QBD81870.1 HD domain-containing protein [Ktedonosporobacter rubrisoli]